MMLLPLNKPESERLLLRDLQETDALALFEIYSNKEAMQYRNSPPMTQLEEAQTFILNQKLETENHLTLRKAVELKEHKELIGTVMFQFQKDLPTECLIGYSIGAQFWNQGFGREMVQLLVEALKEQKNIQTIKAWTKKENQASNRILELNGFKQVEQEEYPESFLYLKIL